MLLKWLRGISTEPCWFFFEASRQRNSAIYYIYVYVFFSSLFYEIIFLSLSLHIFHDRCVCMFVVRLFHSQIILGIPLPSLPLKSQHANDWSGRWISLLSVIISSFCIPRRKNEEEEDQPIVYTAQTRVQLGPGKKKEKYKRIPLTLFKLVHKVDREWDQQLHVALLVKLEFSIELNS